MLMEHETSSSFSLEVSCSISIFRFSFWSCSSSLTAAWLPALASSNCLECFISNLCCSALYLFFSASWNFLNLSFSSMGVITSCRLVTLILRLSLYIISLAFISALILLGRALLSSAWFLAISSSLLSIILLRWSSSFSWCTSIWCLCRKNISLSCLLASWCLSCSCLSSISHKAASLALISCCFCWRNCLSKSATFSLCVSESRFMCDSCDSFSLSTKPLSQKQL